MLKRFPAVFPLFRRPGQFTAPGEGKHGEVYGSSHAHCPCYPGLASFPFRRFSPSPACPDPAVAAPRTPDALPAASDLCAEVSVALRRVAVYLSTDYSMSVRRTMRWIPEPRHSCDLLIGQPSVMPSFGAEPTAAGARAEGRMIVAAGS